MSWLPVFEITMHADIWKIKVHPTSKEWQEKAPIIPRINEGQARSETSIDQKHQFDAATVILKQAINKGIEKLPWYQSILRPKVVWRIPKSNSDLVTKTGTETVLFNISISAGFRTAEFELF
jgi:hypothetical protein